LRRRWCDERRSRRSLRALDDGEIVSPSSSGRRTDRRLKPPYYAEAGIEHLWRLELEPRPALIVCGLRNGRYAERAVAEEGRTTLIEKPFPVEVDPEALIRRTR
jgi:hypothetical protein